jgi:serine/threonine protein kinase
MEDVIRSGYQIVQRLGTGAFGETFLAQKDSCPYTVKIPTNERGREILGDEIAILSRIRPSCSEHFTCLEEIITDEFDLEVAFTARYAPGVPVGNLIGVGTPTMSELDDILTGILAGMTIFHQMGIAHRDIKLGNVLYDRPSRNTTIIDFGLAVSGDSTRISGSRRYFSPEIVGEKTKFTLPVLQRGDIYATGIVLHMLMFDEMPYEELPSSTVGQQNFDYSTYERWKYDNPEVSDRGHSADDLSDIVEQMILSPTTARELLSKWSPNYPIL